MISFKVSQLDLIALKRNNIKISSNTIMIVLIAKGTQGSSRYFAIIDNSGITTTASKLPMTTVATVVLLVFIGLICSNNGIAHDEEGRISVQEGRVRAPSGTSECVCSDCVSIVSFQIYEETSHTCECSDCETEFTTTTATRKDSKDSKVDSK